MSTEWRCQSRGISAFGVGWGLGMDEGLWAVMVRGFAVVVMVEVNDE